MSDRYFNIDIETISFREDISHWVVPQAADPSALRPSWRGQPGPSAASCCSAQAGVSLPSFFSWCSYRAIDAFRPARPAALRPFGPTAHPVSRAGQTDTAGRTLTMTSNNKFNVHMPTYAQASSVFLPPLLASPLKMLSRTRVLVQAFAARARARTGVDVLL